MVHILESVIQILEFSSGSQSFLQNIFIPVLFAHFGGYLRQKRSAHQFYDSLDGVSNFGVVVGWPLRIVIQQLFGCYVWHTPRSSVHRQPERYTRNELPAKRGDYFLLDVLLFTLNWDYSKID